MFITTININSWVVLIILGTSLFKRTFKWGLRFTKKEGSRERRSYYKDLGRKEDTGRVSS